MPKPSTYPALTDHLKQFSISDLKKWGYLKPSQRQTGAISWSINGDKTGSIAIGVNTRGENWYLLLEYVLTDTQEPIRQVIPLVSKPSNLGKGRVWYFQCPRVNKNCRKLYLIGKHFQHREALKGGMYECQTYSKVYRMWNALHKAEEAWEEASKPYLKASYAGKRTKRYLRLLKAIKRGQDFNNAILARAERGLLP